MDKKLYDVSIVVPVYKSASIIIELYKRIEDVMDKKYLYEVIFVCDQSPDESWQLIDGLVRKYKNVRGILLRINAGQHNALMAGISRSMGKFIITIDDDLQHSPTDIPALLEEVKKGYDLVYGKFTDPKHALWKAVGSKFNNLVASYLLDKPKKLYLSPFRAFKGELVKDIIRYKGPYVYVDGLLLSITKNISSINVSHNERYDGYSNYGFIKSLSLWLKMATSFSIVPLRLTSIIGLLMSLIGFLFALILIIQKFTLNIMPVGWTSLIVTILIVGGIQLFALGLLGEYLGRALLTINSKPQYVIAADIGFQ